MLPFLKKKPFLRDLIPADYTDIHSHLLPGIDDGAKTPDQTASLVDDLKKIGFTRFICTPHIMASVWENDSESISNALKIANQHLQKSGDKTKLIAAAEYLLDGNFNEAFKNEPLLTLSGNYVLVEMSYINPPIQLYQILFELQVAGYTPVLAHPERYSFYQKNPEEFKKLKNAGCKFQLNLLSIMGYYGPDVYKVSERLLKNGMFDFSGSDVHHQKHVSALEKRILLKDHQPLLETLKNNSLFSF